MQRKQPWRCSKELEFRSKQKVFLDKDKNSDFQQMWIAQGFKVALRFSGMETFNQRETNTHSKLTLSLEGKSSNDVSKANTSSQKPRNRYLERMIFSYLTQNITNNAQTIRLKA